MLSSHSLRKADEAFKIHNKMYKIEVTHKRAESHSVSHHRVWCCRASPGSSRPHTCVPRFWEGDWSRSGSSWSAPLHSAYHSGTTGSSETSPHPLQGEHTHTHSLSLVGSCSALKISNGELHAFQTFGFLHQIDF